MGMKVMDAGSVLRTITKCRVLDGGSLRNIIRMKVMDSDDATLRTVAVFAGPLSLTAPSVFNGGFGAIFSGSSTAAPTGGLGPYSYSWSLVSGVAMLSSGGSTATANFTSPTLSPEQTVSAIYRCTCTDSSGQSATDDISVDFQSFQAPF